ncbi:MAG: TonB-dependent receptor [Panacagrimonas sp.]
MRLGALDGRRRLGACILRLTGLVLLCELNPAHAQDQAADQPVSHAPMVLDPLVVTGYRHSLEDSLALKRENAGVVDVILAEDIGKFPESNLAEALQRVPGVSLVRDRGEGTQISVRGLNADLTRVRINGMEAQATTKGVDDVNRSRGFDFSIFAAELFGRAEVRKTASADVDEGSLGATVDLRTPRPFDFGKPVLLASGQGAYDEISRDYDPRATLLVSEISSDGQLGALFSAAWSRRSSQVEGSDSGLWAPGSRNGGFCDPSNADGACAGEPQPVGASVGELNSSDVFHPRFPNYVYQQLEQERLGFTGAVQFRPAPGSELVFEALYADLDVERREKNLEAIGFSRGESQAGKPEIVVREALIENNNLVFGRFDNVDVRAENVEDRYRTKFGQYTLTGNRRLSDRLQANGLLGYSQSDFRNPIFTTVQMDRFNTDGYSWDLRRKRGLPQTNYGFDVNDPASWYISPAVSTGPDRATGPEIRLLPSAVDNRYRLAQIDLQHDTSDRLKLKGGVQLKRFDFDSFARRLADQRVVPELPAGVMVADLTERFDGLQSINVPDGTPSTWLVPSVDRYADVFGIYSNTGVFALQGVENASARGDIRSVRETDLGVWVQTEWQGMTLAGIPLRGDVGLRWAQTRQRSSGYGDAGADPVRISVSRDYEEWLPALNLVAEFSDEWLGRFSAAKVIARPTLGAITPGGSVSVSGGSRFVSLGNPELDPFRANTYDLSLEWYFAPQSLLSGGLFYKSIDSYIQFLTRTVRFEELDFPARLLDGTGATPQDEFLFNRPVNTPGGPLRGAELAYQQRLGFLNRRLEDFGLLLNFTYADSDIDYVVDDSTGETVRGPLIGLSRRAWNATFYYDDGRLGARLSGAYRSQYLRTVPGPFGNDVSGTRESLFLDAAASWKLKPNLSLSLEALNLTDRFEDRYLDTSERWDLRTHHGRQVFLGLRYGI